MNISWAVRSCSRASSAAALAAQPFAVEQVRAGELHADAGAAEPVDRLAVEALGGLALAEQRPRAGLDPERPVGAAGAASISESRRSASAARSGVPAAGGRLDQLDQRPGRRAELRRVLGGLLGRGQRVVVAAEAVVEHRARPVRERRARSLAAAHRVLLRGARSAPTPRPRGPARRRAPGGVGREVAAGRLGDRLRLLDQRRGGGELAGEQVHAARGS